MNRLVQKLIIAIIALSFILTAFAANAAPSKTEAMVKKMKATKKELMAGVTSTNLPVHVVFINEVKRDKQGLMNPDLEALFSTIPSIKDTKNRAERANMISDESYASAIRRDNSVSTSTREALYKTNACDINGRGDVCVVVEKSLQNGKIVVEAYNLVTAESDRFKEYREVARKKITAKQVAGLSSKLGRMTKGKAAGIYIYSSLPSAEYMEALKKELMQAASTITSPQTKIAGNEVIDVTAADERAQILKLFASDVAAPLTAPARNIYRADDPNIPRGPGVLHIVKPVGNNARDINDYLIEVVTDASALSTFDANYTKQVQTNAHLGGEAGEQYVNASGPALFNTCYVTSELKLRKTNKIWQFWKILDFLFQKTDENGNLIVANKSGKGFLDCILHDGTRQHVKIVLKDYPFRIGFIYSKTTEKIFSFGVGWANGALDILLLRTFGYFNVLPTAQLLVTGALVNPIIIREDISKKPVFAFAAAVTLPPNVEAGDSPLMLNAYLSFVGKYEISIDPDDT